jgi:predicted metal-dependent HD superfamily phosphohydrolase
MAGGMKIPARFVSLFDNLGVNDRTRSFIIEAHSAPDRHYHGLGHLALMCNYFVAAFEAEKSRFLAEYAPSFMLATLFHDVVYDPKAPPGKNEEDSAIEFQLRHPAHKWADTDLVVDMILATRSHEMQSVSGDMTFRKLERARAINHFLSADLHILWHPKPHVYEWYARGVRKEYAWVPNDKYREGRARVLDSLSTVQTRLDRFDLAAFKANQEWEKNALRAGALDV